MPVYRRLPAVAASVGRQRPADRGPRPDGCLTPRAVAQGQVRPGQDGDDACQADGPPHACLIGLVDRFLADRPGVPARAGLGAGGEHVSKASTKADGPRQWLEPGGMAPALGVWREPPALGGCSVCSPPPGSCCLPPPFRHGLCPAVKRQANGGKHRVAPGCRPGRYRPPLPGSGPPPPRQRRTYPSIGAPGVSQLVIVLRRCRRSGARFAAQHSGSREPTLNGRRPGGRPQRAPAAKSASHLWNRRRPERDNLRAVTRRQGAVVSRSYSALYG
jgi:hypothetical protein